MKSTLALLLASGTIAAGLAVSGQSLAAGQPASSAQPPSAQPSPAPAPSMAAPTHQTAATTSPPAAQERTRRPFDVRRDLTMAWTDLAYGQRLAAERRLDEAATFLLNSQAAERGRLGPGSPTRYDKSVDDVIGAFHAARAGRIDAARAMVDQALDALETVG